MQNPSTTEEIKATGVLVQGYLDAGDIRGWVAHALARFENLYGFDARCGDEQGEGVGEDRARAYGSFSILRRIRDDFPITQ